VARAYPDTPVIRAEPNLPVEVRRGVISIAESDADPELRRAVRELFARVGTVVELPERLMTVAGGCAGVGPAYWALLIEAQVDAAVRRGIPAPQASELVAGTMRGTAELLHARGVDTLALRREVTSPGGTTSRGLAALERGGVRAAFHAALDAVVDG
jgi:pyrroline-5-carboxylate reductase